jgi:hypothetical protein
MPGRQYEEPRRACIHTRQPRALFLRRRFCGSWIGFSPALLVWRRGHAPLIVVDLHRIGLSVFAIIVVGQALGRLRARRGVRLAITMLLRFAIRARRSHRGWWEPPRLEKVSLVATEHNAQFLFGLLEGVLPFSGKVPASPLHIKGQHQHRRSKRASDGHSIRPSAWAT